MGAVVTYDEILNRVGGGYTLSEAIGGLIESNAVVMGGNNVGFHRIGRIKTLPSLPSGVSAYIPASISLETSTSGTYCAIAAQMTDLGELNVGTNTFTDGSSMPTRTELGVSRTTSGPVFREVTTAMNSNPGSFTITYVDQDGNSAEATSSQTIGNSSVVGNSGFVVLNSPDVGVRDITASSRTGGASHAGVMKFWGITPIAILSHVTGSQGLGEFVNLLTSKFNCQRLPASAQVGIFVMNSGAKAVQGNIFFVGDST